jgi:glycosyltransferase involved in cell wall biosynthesis
VTVRVLLDTTFARRAPHSGTAVYLAELAQALRARGDIELIEVANARRGGAGAGRMASVRNALADELWAAVTLPLLARDTRADVIHHPLPAHAVLTRTPQVITVHDLAFERLPDHFDPRFRAFARFAHRRAARSADVVVCVSETTASEARELWGISPGRIVVAPHGPGQRLPPVPLRARTHFLYVGDDEPRKDVATLLAAHRGYRERNAHPLDLVLAGTAHATAPGVRNERRPAAARLAELYAGAVALVHPSLYEGFGMTPLEAMRAGAPVIAAAATSVTEVCGDAALSVAPSDAGALAAAMTRVATDPAYCEELAARGVRRAAEYSWEASARSHMDAYSLVASR